MKVNKVKVNKVKVNKVNKDVITVKQGWIDSNIYSKLK